MRTIGVDTGGTFTDLAERDGEELRVRKLASTPAAPADAVRRGIEHFGGARRGDHVVHGTTVGLNALLTGRVARVALVASAGFADVLEIGRQDRPDIYALEPEPAPELVPRARRFEVPERRWPDPARPSGPLIAVREPTAAELKALVARVRRAKPDSVAVCLLHSYAEPEHERRVAAALSRLGVPITTSAGILPEHREVERFSTAVVNAALVPLMRDYLGPLEAELAPAKLSILQSSGGTLPAARAAVEPVRVLLSGPAGGVVGAARAARQAGFARMVGLDMGGTSSDVSFHDARAGSAVASPLSPVRVAGHAVGVPSLDIHTVGCGGGSLITVDSGGVLHVGPQSAGADPGPVCYGRSDAPTITDAHVLLGHVAAGAFLGGELSLDHAAVARAFERLGKRLGIPAREAARASLEVARASMRRAVGVMTMQRGVDPRSVPLVAFGGAGGLHAAALAKSLGMQAALVPRFPGALSAAGMATADAVREHALSVLAPLAEWGAQRRGRALAELDRAGGRSLREAGHRRNVPGTDGGSDVVFEHRADVRYRGQSFELLLADGPSLEAAFHRAHEDLYGYRLDGREIELVCLRSRAIAATPRQRATKPRPRALPAEAVRGERRATFVGFGRRTAVAARVIEREALPLGARFDGPALVEEYSGTTLVPPGWSASVTAGAHLLLRPS